MSVLEEHRKLDEEVVDEAAKAFEKLTQQNSNWKNINQFCFVAKKKEKKLSFYFGEIHNFVFLYESLKKLKKKKKKEIL